MRLTILELFSGTESFSKVARERGHEVFTIDNNPIFKPDLCKNIIDVNLKDLPFKPDIIWASPPCQTFSVMSIRHHWNKNKTPKSKDCLIGIKLVKKTLKLIKELKPKFWFIENPRAMLRKQDFMPQNKIKTITYCKYGTEYMKPTDIWTNCFYWKSRPMCKNGDPCHIRAPRGSRKGIQNSMRGSLKVRHYSTGHLDLTYNSAIIPKIMRGIIPRELCLEIIKACEK